LKPKPLPGVSEISPDSWLEHVQSPEKRVWNLAGDLIPREVDNFQAVEIGDGCRKVAGEVVVVEVEAGI
jgi:hypothetical protein